MYINSAFQNSGTTTNNADPTSIFIGKFGTTSTFFSNINLLQFKYYSKSLSENEITQNYNAIKTRFNI